MTSWQALFRSGNDLVTAQDFYRGHRQWLREMHWAGLLLPQAVGAGYFARSDWRACVWESEGEERQDTRRDGQCDHEGVTENLLDHNVLHQCLQAGFMVQQLRIRGDWNRTLWAIAGRVTPEADMIPCRSTSARRLWQVEHWLDFYSRLLQLPRSISYEPQWLLPQHLPVVHLEDKSTGLHLQHRSGTLQVRHFILDPEHSGLDQRLHDQGLHIDARHWFSCEGRFWVMRCLSVFTDKPVTQVPGAWTEDRFYRPLLLAVNTPMGLDSLRCQALVSMRRCRRWTSGKVLFTGSHRGATA